MQVETFECSETAAEPIEACEEAVALMDELGLSGQQELLCKSKDGTRDARCPYREITAQETFVYRTLCPEEVELKNYKASPVPLRVLQIAAHAQSIGMFGKLMVWDRTSVTVKDPVLVGCVMHPDYSWSVQKTFILARWGEELETFAVLMKRAMGMARERLVQEADTLAQKVRCLSDEEILRAGFSKRIEW